MMNIKYINDLPVKMGDYDNLQKRITAILEEFHAWLSREFYINQKGDLIELFGQRFKISLIVTFSDLSNPLLKIHRLVYDLNHKLSQHVEVHTVPVHQITRSRSRGRWDEYANMLEAMCRHLAEDNIELVING